MKNKIKFAEFLELEKQLEITAGKVVLVEDVPKSDKLIKLSVDFGDIRTVVTNIKPQLKDPKSLEGKTFLFITNLEPVKMMGIESHAMILPGEIESITTIDSKVGTKIL
jgi:methionine--tRNA ligase beta chain